MICSGFYTVCCGAPPSTVVNIVSCSLQNKRPVALLLDAGLLIVTSMRLLPNVVIPRADVKESRSESKMHFTDS